MPSRIANQRTTLRHSITNGIGKFDTTHKFFHLLIQGSTTNHQFHEVSPEEVGDFLAYLVKQTITKDRNAQHRLHRLLFQLGQHILLYHLLHNERNGDDEWWLYISIRLENNLRTRCARKELGMATLYELEEERKKQTKGMCHRQHTHMTVTCLQFDMLMRKNKIWYQTTIRYHHAFGKACRTRSITDIRQLLWLFLMIAYLFWRKSMRKFLLKLKYHLFLDGRYLLVTWNEYRIVYDGNNHLSTRHGLFIKVFPHIITNEQQLCIRMVDNVMDVFCLEIMKDGNTNGTVCQRSKKRHAPIRTITSAKSNLITLFDSN